MTQRTSEAPTDSGRDAPVRWEATVAFVERPARILVVDDDPLAEIEVGTPLARLGYDVLSVRDAEAALLLLRRVRCDLVLLNTDLRGMSGFDLCRLLRDTADVAVVFHSSRGALVERLRAFDAGADDFVIRPASAAEVASRVRAVLRRSRRPSVPMLALDGLVIDVRGRSIEVGGVPLSATPREFDLLRLLLERRGEVLSADLISTQVWGYETFGSHNFVEAQLSRLRAKLRAAGAACVISTVRGSGYVIR